MSRNRKTTPKEAGFEDRLDTIQRLLFEMTLLYADQYKFTETEEEIWFSFLQGRLSEQPGHLKDLRKRVA